ncbi:unnamed protein product, partial [Linum tenue]
MRKGLRILLGNNIIRTCKMTVIYVVIYSIDSDQTIQNSLASIEFHHPLASTVAH